MASGAPTPAIAAIWKRQLPQTRERLQLLRRAADEATTSRTLDTGLHAEALDVAHKLAGSLGMFGFLDATEHARAIEHELEHTGLPQPERLEAHVAALEASLADALNDIG